MSVSPVDMAADYRKAAQVIRDGGLAKDIYETPGGQHCLIGALRSANRTVQYHFNQPRVDAEMRFAAELLGDPVAAGIGDVGLCDRGDTVFPGFTTITEWNDAPERTAEDVATLLEQAAEKLEADL